MRSLYVDGNSFLHRLPAGLKLAGLIALSIALFLSDRLSYLSAFLAVAAVLYFSLPLGPRQALVRLLPVFAAIVLVGVFSLIFNGWHPAAATVMRLCALMLFAAAVTAATTVTAFIDVTTRAARPLEKAGLVKAADIGLAIGLVIRFVPDIMSRYEAIREAHRARGIALKPMSMLIPLVILTLRDADGIADAIDARGIRGATDPKKTG